MCLTGNNHVGMLFFRKVSEYMKTLTYKTQNNLDIEGTLYETAEANAPLLMYIHGGGLIWGTDADIDKRQVELYTRSGFNVFSINYRLAPESKLPDIIGDVQDALKWLVQHGKEHADFDPDKIAVIGASAGAYLALMTGTLKTRPQAIVSFYGYGDITGDWYLKPSPHFSKMARVPEALAKQLIGNEPISASPIEKRYAIYLYCRQQGKWIDYVTGIQSDGDLTPLQEYCPLRLIDSYYPPTLLLHGDDDEDVPYDESVNMKKALSDASVSSKLITIKGGKHTFDEDMDDAQVAGAFKEVIQFLKEQLQ